MYTCYYRKAGADRLLRKVSNFEFRLYQKRRGFINLAKQIVPSQECVPLNVPGDEAACRE